MGCGSGRGREKEGPALKKVGKAYHQASPQQWSLSPPAGSAGNWCFCPELLFRNTEKNSCLEKKVKEAEFTGGQSYTFAVAHLRWEPGWVDGSGLHPLRSEAPLRYAEF